MAKLKVSKSTLKKRLEIVLGMARPMAIQPHMTVGRKAKKLSAVADRQRKAIQTVESFHQSL